MIVVTLLAIVRLTIVRLLAIPRLVIAWLNVPCMHILHTTLNSYQWSITHGYFAIRNFGILLQPVWGTADTSVTKTVIAVARAFTAVATCQTVSEHFLRFAAPVPDTADELSITATDPKKVTPPTLARQTLTHRSNL